MKNKTFEIYLENEQDSALLEVSVDVFKDDFAIVYVYNLETANYEETLYWTNEDRDALEREIKKKLYKDDVINELSYFN